MQYGRDNLREGLGLIIYTNGSEEMKGSFNHW